MNKRLISFDLSEGEGIKLNYAKDISELYDQFCEIQRPADHVIVCISPDYEETEVDITSFLISKINVDFVIYIYHYHSLPESIQRRFKYTFVWYEPGRLRHYWYDLVDIRTILL